MSLSRQSLELDKQIPHLLFRLKIEFGVGIKDQLNLNRTQWMRLMNGHSIDWSAYRSLLERLGLNVNSFSFRAIDQEAVLAHLKGNQDYAPKEYEKAAFSSRRIGRNIINILDDYFGDEMRLAVLRTLQIGEDFFAPENDHKKVCTLLYAHIYSVLKNLYGLNDQELYWIGQKTAFYNQDTPLRARLGGKKMEEAYAEYLEEVARVVEQSYQYELAKLNHKTVVFRKRYSPQLQELLQSNKYGNHETCIYSMGFTSSIGFYAEGRFPISKKTSCLYAGDKYSEFTLSLEDFKQPSLFSRPGLLQ